MLINTIMHLNVLMTTTNYNIEKPSKILLGKGINEKYKNKFEDEFNIPLSKVIEKIKELDYNSVSSKNKILIDCDSLGKILVIGKKTRENRCRLLILNNIANYKKTTLYIKLKLIVNKIKE